MEFRGETELVDPALGSAEAGQAAMEDISAGSDVSARIDQSAGIGQSARVDASADAGASAAGGYIGDVPRGDQPMEVGQVTMKRQRLTEIERAQERQDIVRKAQRLGEQGHQLVANMSRVNRGLRPRHPVTVVDVGVDSDDEETDYESASSETEDGEDVYADMPRMEVTPPASPQRGHTVERQRLILPDRLPDSLQPARLRESQSPLRWPEGELMDGVADRGRPVVSRAPAGRTPYTVRQEPRVGPSGPTLWCPEARPQVTSTPGGPGAPGGQRPMGNDSGYQDWVQPPSFVPRSTHDESHRLPDEMASPCRRATARSGSAGRPIVNASTPVDPLTNSARTYTWQEVEAILAQNADKISTAAVRMIEATSPNASQGGGDAYNAQLLKRIDRSLASPRRKDMSVESFGGDLQEDWQDYLTKFASAAKWNNWSNEDRLQQLVGHLKGNALALYADYKPRTYSELVKVITNRFAPSGSEESFKLKFRSESMDFDGDASVYAQNLARFARRAFPTWSNEAVGEYVQDQFKQGLTDGGMRKHIVLGRYQSLNEMVVATGAYQRFEEGNRPSRTVKPARKPEVAAKCATAQATEEAGEEEPDVQVQMGKLAAALSVISKNNADLNDKVDRARDRPAYSGAGRPAYGGTGGGRRTRRTVKCWICQQEGHDSHHCPQNPNDDWTGYTPEQAARDASTKAFRRLSAEKKGATWKGKSSPNSSGGGTGSPLN